MPKPQNKFIKKIQNFANHQSTQIIVSQILAAIHKEVQQTISNKYVEKVIKSQIGKYIATAEKQSIAVFSQKAPNLPFRFSEDDHPTKIQGDIQRPFSAKINKLYKVKASSSKIASLTKFFLRSNYSNKKSKHSEKKQNYQSKIKQLQFMNNIVQKDKKIDLLRKIKSQSEQYQKNRYIFLDSIEKQEQIYKKKQTRFASAMNRKDFTYSYLSEIIYIEEKNKNKKKIPKSSYRITSEGNEQNNSKCLSPQIITVKHTRKNSVAQSEAKEKDHKYKISDKYSPFLLCPQDTLNTKYSLIS